MTERRGELSQRVVGKRGSTKSTRGVSTGAFLGGEAVDAAPSSPPREKRGRPCVNGG